MACLLSVVDNEYDSSEREGEISSCTCHINSKNSDVHYCPSNKLFLPVTNCRKHPECNDPIYACFDLAALSNKLAKRMPEYGEEYEEISRLATSLSVSFLDQCINTDEVKLLLAEDSGSKKYFKLFNDVSKLVKIIKYPRLMLAIELNNKEFVGHMYCQQMLKEEWYCNQSWQGTSKLYKVH